MLKLDAGFDGASLALFGVRGHGGGVGQGRVGVFGDDGRDLKEGELNLVVFLLWVGRLESIWEKIGRNRIEVIQVRGVGFWVGGGGVGGKVISPTTNIKALVLLGTACDVLGRVETFKNVLTRVFPCRACKTYAGTIIF